MNVKSMCDIYIRQENAWRCVNFRDKKLHINDGKARIHIIKSVDE